MIDSEQIIIDEDARINENVIIGGTKTPDSLIKIGKRVIIMEYSFINPTKSIIIGDDSGIGGHCLLFTHGSWLNQLDGFPVTFAPINIGKNVWLPWRVFVMPGVTIGDNVVIGAQSLITTDLPSNVLAAGSPAKVIKENYPKKISEEKRQELIAQIIVEFKTYLEYNAVHTKQDNFNEGSILIVNKKNKNQRLLFLNKIPKSDFLMEKIDLLVIDCKTESKFDAKMILDLQNKTRTGSSPLGEEFSKYLSRHGIRFNRLD
jgi:acetyltransferase-like isoleucine patch superfamily enzyme